MAIVISRVSLPFESNQEQNRESTSTNTQRCSASLLATTRSLGFKKPLSFQFTELYKRVLTTCQELTKKQGVHSSISMIAAGFSYTGNEDTVRCNTCELEVSGWTLEMKPFTIHAQRSPTCSFVRSMQPNDIIAVIPTKDFHTVNSVIDGGNEQPSKRQKTETTQEIGPVNILMETNTLKQIRKRNFSHWPHRTAPSTSQMIEAGFFNCNVGDRVMCLYCNIICQQWTSQDDPYEVHKTLSPRCPFVIAMTKHQEMSTIRIVNEQSTIDNSATTLNNDPFRCHEIVYTAACHPAYMEIPKRYASFDAWSNENVPPVDDLVRAGFFFTGTKTIVTCFYCNGSLQNWGAKDNPMIEHARWFPHCAYAKQLCGADLYRRIQESKRAQQERAKGNEGNKRLGNYEYGSGRGQLNIPDESMLSRYVAARLDLPISQSLLDRNYKLSVIKRCWEDQLRLKHDDFLDYCDLFVACIVLQQQIEVIDGKKENIIVPTVAINKIRAKEQAEIAAREQTTRASSMASSTNNTDTMHSTSSESIADEENTEQSTIKIQEKSEIKAEKTKIPVKDHTDDSASSNLCVLCLEEEKRLACIPCGHLATCVPCGHSLRSCPICRTAIDAFVRIYL